MNEEELEEILGKISKTTNISVNDIRGIYDKFIKTSQTNKDGHELYLLRNVSIKKYSDERVKNQWTYVICSNDGKIIGDIKVSNNSLSKKSNQAEIQYELISSQRNKGNITISLEEVLRDIFLKEHYNEQTVQHPSLANIDEVYLGISSNNLASQAVAKKIGFQQEGTLHTMTKEHFLQRIQEQEKENQIKGAKMEKIDDIIKNYSSSEYDYKQYRNFIVNENPEVVQQLIDFITNNYKNQQNIKTQLKDSEGLYKEMLKDGLNTERETFNVASRILSDFVLKHHSDSEYINSIIEQMPFMNRAAFINESVLSMLGKRAVGQQVEITNILDVFERSIDREVRAKLETKDFEELASELYLDAGIIGNPCGIRNTVPKYDCINFSLYRLDKELGTGVFEKQLDSRLWGEKDLAVYQFSRNIYEEHPATNLAEERFNGKDRFKRNYIEDLYWAQKITQEDRDRICISDYPDLDEEFEYENTTREDTRNDIIEERKSNGLKPPILKRPIFSEQGIGKSTVNISIASKDSSNSRVQQDEQTILQAQEIDEN